jgi:hypothetical protein
MYTPIQPPRGVLVDSLDGAVWHKSSYSGTQGNCVDVATNLPGLVVVRDSKDPDGARLVFTRVAWAVLMRRLKTGGFDLS